MRYPASPPCKAYPARALLPGPPAGEGGADDEALGDEEGAEGGADSHGTKEEGSGLLEEAEPEDCEEEEVIHPEDTERTVRAEGETTAYKGASRGPGWEG